MQLNSQQRAAVRHTDTPLLVIAGAGSGKTGVITQKIAHLLTEQEYAPRSIVAVTFTNKAAEEMRQRLKQRLGDNASKLTRQLSISTFHRLGLDILRKDGRAIGVRPGFTIFDQADSLLAIREILRETQSTIDEKLAAATISQWKSAFVDPSAAAHVATQDHQMACAVLYSRYDEFLRSCNAVDFDDLIRLPVRLLREDTPTRDKWRGRIRHLLVDEYQDTNMAQYELIKLLVDRFGAFTAVGDDDQSIYSWRGADASNLDKLKNDYPNLRVIALEQNYRSSQRILRCANTVIRNNPHTYEKQLWSDLGIGDMLRLSICRHGIDEAEWVASDIMTRHFQKGIPLGNFAILYRSNFQSRLFEQALREKQINYQISGGQSFFDRTEIKDLLAYLRLLVNPDDDTALLRCINTPRREIGPNTLQKLGNHARNRGVSLLAACHDLGLETTLTGKPLIRLQRFANWLTLTADNAIRGDTFGVVRQLLEDIDYTGWVERQADTPLQAERMQSNVDDLMGWIHRLLSDEDQRERSLTDVVNQLSLHDMLARRDDDLDGGQVQLMTLHAAKGLEFAHVYIVGMEEELLPHRNSTDADALEEERRLTYVGLTRARHTLTLTRARSRQRHGQTGAADPSRFLDELPAEDVQILGELGDDSSGNAHAAGQAALKGILDMLGDP